MNKFTLMIATLLLVIITTSSQAQNSSFTYQGRLTAGNVAANGTYDMQFKLVDNNDNQIGSTFTNNSVPVNNGVFTVELDFGAAVFSGPLRYLQIGVRLTGSGDSYELLMPSQPLTSAVYAIRAASTATADNANQLAGVAASQYVKTSDSRLTDARTPTAGSTNYIQNTNALQASSNFNISGNGTAGGALSANSVNTTTQYNLGGQRLLMAVGNSTFGGLDSGKANIGAQDATFFGHSAGEQNTTGTSNTFVGSGAGSSNTSGSYNAFFGTSAGGQSTGNSNSFFGSDSGGATTTGDDNSFFGRNAGHLNKGGSRNSLFGAAAGFAQTGNDNAFFGYSAGVKNTADSNSFFGSHSGEDNVAGTDNSFFGRSAGGSNIDGSQNSFFGEEAGNLNTSAAGNSFFGYKTGFKSTGASNAMFGANSGGENTTGFANSFFGRDAGLGNQGGFDNVFVGRAAGGANVSGNDNTIIGTGANVGSGGLSFATAIGSQATVSTSNTIVLGRSNGSDAVQVPGTLNFGILGVAGNISLCWNVLKQLSNCSSSLRYKKDIQPFTSGLAVLNRLRPITFDWKQGGMHDLGFGAEDVAAIEPLLVTRNDKGEVEGVKYDRITAVLVNAVKEQQEQIKRQQSEIESLKTLVCQRNRRARVCK
jgi:hypothetical protein